MKILILGAGAIGTMLGIKLSLSGADVTFFDQVDVLHKFSDSGMSLKMDGREYRIRKIKTTSSLDLPEHAFDLAVICVKSYHIEDICNSINRKVFTALLTIQNGIGNEEFLAKKYGPHQLFSGTITLPVASIATGESEITNIKGGIGLAAVHKSDSCEELCALFRRAGFETIVYENYKEMKWSKLLLNIIGNALSAILDMSPGEIFDNRKLTKIEKKSIEEGVELMKAMKLNVVDLPGYPVRLITWIFSVLPPTIIEIIMSMQKSMARGKKMPSLHIDLESKSMHSEIEVLNGAIFTEGKRLGISVPANRLLYEILSGIVNGEISRDEYRKKPEKLYDRFNGLLVTD